MTAGIGVEATVAPPMIDIQLVRNDVDGVKKALARKGVDPAEVDRLAEADRRVRDVSGERAVKISGSMFTMPRGQGATLSRALAQLALDSNADAFEEIRPPSLVTSATLTATGQLPKFADDAYHVERDDLWLIPTAEVPLTSMASGEILDEADLPVRMMAYTPCYRRQAGSARRDTRGT